MTDMNLVQSLDRRAVRGTLSEAVVDLSAIRDNVRTFRRLIPQDVLAVVKADAFGHGAVPVARAAVEAGELAVCLLYTSDAADEL